MSAAAHVHAAAGPEASHVANSHTTKSHITKPSTHDHAAHGHAAPASEPQNTAPDGTHALPTTCCGVFCISAIAPPVELTAVYSPLSSSLAPPVTGFMSGQDPSRIDRPPRSLVLI